MLWFILCINKKGVGYFSYDLEWVLYGNIIFYNIIYNFKNKINIICIFIVKMNFIN